MPDAKISELTAVSAVLAAQEIAVNDAATSRKVSIAQLEQYLQRRLRPPDIMLRAGAGTGAPEFVGPGAAVSSTGGGSGGYMDHTTVIYSRPRYQQSGPTGATDERNVLSWGEMNSVALLRRDRGFRVEMVFRPLALHTAPELNGFFGVRAALMSTTEAVLTAAVDCIGVGFNRTGYVTGNMHTVHNDAAGAPTVADLGSSYPAESGTANGSAGDGDGYYRLVLECAPGGSTVTWELYGLVTGVSTGGTFSSNLPSSTTPLRVHCGQNKTGSDTSAYALEVESSDVWIGSPLAAV